MIAKEADLLIGFGKRYSDFKTACKTACKNPKGRFINFNGAEFDAFKPWALPRLCDARAAIELLSKALRDWTVSASYRKRGDKLRRDWDKEVERLYKTRTGVPVGQAEVV